MNGHDEYDPAPRQTVRLRERACPDLEQQSDGRSAFRERAARSNRYWRIRSDGEGLGELASGPLTVPARRSLWQRLLGRLLRL